MSVEHDIARAVLSLIRIDAPDGTAVVVRRDGFVINVTFAGEDDLDPVRDLIEQVRAEERAKAEAEAAGMRERLEGAHKLSGALITERDGMFDELGEARELLRRYLDSPPGEMLPDKQVSAFLVKHDAKGGAERLTTENRAQLIRALTGQAWAVACWAGSSMICEMDLQHLAALPSPADLADEILGGGR